METDRQKLRVLVFSTAYLPHLGGAEVAVKEITDRLPAISFTMITARLKSDLPAYEKVGNVDVYRIGNGSGLDKFRLFFAGVKKALELKKEGNFDLVWAVMASYAGFAALRYKNITGAKLLLTLQEGDSKAHIYSRVWFVWPWFKQIFRRADRIQAISNYLAEWARQMGARCMIDVVPNGVEMRTLYLLRDNLQLGTPRELRSRLSIPQSAKIVISVSRLVKKNGLLDLVGAIALLPDSVHLIILGSGEMRDKLEDTMKEMRIIHRVHLVGDVLHGDVVRYLSASDVFCRPSKSEGLGNAFIEAMAAGVPVIATPVGGIPDFLEDGETGFFCEVDNPKSIAEKIRYILDENNAPEIQHIKSAAQELVSKRFLWDNIALQMKGIFETV